jgi:hypothetical protein
MARREVCEVCSGTGRCRLCHGLGEFQATRSHRSPLGCAACLGSGQCPECNGDGLADRIARRRRFADLPARGHTLAR